MLSRVAGLVRDLLIGAFLGAGPVADAFIAAFSLPNMFRRFFAEGAFNMAFVPMFSKKLEADDDPKGFAAEAFAGLATVLIILTLVAQLAMPFLVLAMTSGFAADERFDLAVFYGRICFPYILFISLAALLSGVLNASGRFAAAAAAPVLLNAILVASLLLGYYLELDFGLALSVGVTLAGIGQFFLVWKAASLAGFHIVPQRPRLSPDLKRLMVIALPAAMAGGVMQINLLVGRQVASYFDGAVSWLYYADRLYQLPLGVVGIAIGIVLLPDLSRKLQAEDTTGGGHAFNRATEFALVLTLPCAAALIVIPWALISVLFERGSFTAADSAATAAALAVYGAGLPAFVMQKVLQPLYFAREDTKTPFYYAAVSMILNAILAIGLSYYLGYLAAAIGTTLSSIALAVLLWRGTAGMGPAAAFDDQLKRSFPRIIAATLVMTAVIYGVSVLQSDLLARTGWRYAALAILIGSGIVSYFLAALALGAFTRDSLRAVLRRKAK
ncbi:MAG: murein biosynthesis integral membrane protein MurJ [Rhodobacteraceae bacterium]|nr:murein biosynthesis integral membrane protein MurJ [Paracoccaceae bacterium]